MASQEKAICKLNSKNVQLKKTLKEVQSQRPSPPLHDLAQQLDNALQKVFQIFFVTLDGTVLLHLCYLPTSSATGNRTFQTVDKLIKNFSVEWHHLEVFRWLCWIIGICAENEEGPSNLSPSL
jgi:hypothetical protein